MYKSARFGDAVYISHSDEEKAWFEALDDEGQLFVIQHREIHFCLTGYLHEIKKIALESPSPSLKRLDQAIRDDINELSEELEIFKQKTGLHPIGQKAPQLVRSIL